MCVRIRRLEVLQIDPNLFHLFMITQVDLPLAVLVREQRATTLVQFWTLVRAQLLDQHGVTLLHHWPSSDHDLHGVIRAEDHFLEHNEPASPALVS